MSDRAYESKTLFVTVKTYPNPSRKHIETTCVSGITDEGCWMRLHPVHFRLLEDNSQFQRYSWIRVRVNKATQDPRPESYHLDESKIGIIRYTTTDNMWQERREIIEPLLSRSIEDLQDQQACSRTSLGAIRPKEITRFQIKDADPHWSPEQRAKLSQLGLFSPQNVPLLEKIPFEFVYDFSCDDPRCNGHSMQVFDWEVAQSYRKWSRDKSRTEWEKQFRDMYDYRVRKMCDTIFFMGTLAKYPTTWTIGGIFFAPKQRPQPTLW